MKKMVFWALACLLVAGQAHAAGFIVNWETPGCPADCKYMAGYEVRAVNQEFDLTYQAQAGGVSSSFTEQFTLPHTPTSDVDFYVRSIDDQGEVSAWAGPAPLPAAAWSSPANPYTPTINSVTAVP